MKPEMIGPHSQLERLVNGNKLTAGMYVRVHGKNLILGRRESFGPEGVEENDDRVRLTQRNQLSYALSVKRYTGRWQRTPFAGSLEEVFEVMLVVMQHLLQPIAPV